jgi:hypothetical protein
MYMDYDKSHNPILITGRDKEYFRLGGINIVRLSAIIYS